MTCVKVCGFWGGPPVPKVVCSMLQFPEKEGTLEGRSDLQGGGGMGFLT